MNEKSCSAESLTLSSSNTDSQTFCGQQSSVLVYETCSNTLKINLKTSSTSEFKRGVSIYYEEIVKPSDFNCAIKTTKPSTTTSTTTTSTSTTVTVTKPVYQGFASSIQSMSSCDKKNSIYCPQDYLIVMQSSVYGVKPNSDSSACFYEYAQTLKFCFSFIIQTFVLFSQVKMIVMDCFCVQSIAPVNKIVLLISHLALL